MLDIIILITLVLFFQYIFHRDQKEYREFRYWKAKQGEKYSPSASQEPPAPAAPQPPINDPNVIDFRKYKQAK